MYLDLKIKPAKQCSTLCFSVMRMWSGICQWKWKHCTHKAAVVNHKLIMQMGSEDHLVLVAQTPLAHLAHIA